MLCAMLSCLLRSVSAGAATPSGTHARSSTAARSTTRLTVPRRTMTMATIKHAMAASTTGARLLSEGFSASATTSSGWIGYGDACLTAGTPTTPPTSVVACGSAAPQDADGQGALQLTTGAGSQSGMIVSSTPLPTANGLAVTFTDYAFNGSTVGADGLLFFLSDASKPVPAPGQGGGGSFGYSGTATSPGIANSYVGVALDEFGNFSNPSGHTGGPGPIPETIAVRGSASTLWQYLGGATNAAGQAASLPFNFDQPSLTTRPVNAPTIRATLTPAGVLSVSIDIHNGSGFQTYYSQMIAGVGGQPAVPSQVYFGMGAVTGGLWNRHQISGLVVSSLVTPPTATALFSEPFSGSATTANAWTGYGGTCLTAGTATTPTSSIPACGIAAAQDTIGQGALQLTTSAGSKVGMAVLGTPLSTANGLAVTFTDYAFNGTSTGADGMSVFFSDASKPIPKPGAGGGGSLGYSGTAAMTGMANAYVGVALDEYGNFSNPVGHTGGPGKVRETVAVRGAASTLWQYLGGATNAAGQAASLPFNFDQPLLTTRPANAPTIRATLSAAGLLSVAIDHHDGSGFQTYYSQPIVGLSAQPALPARVYLGVSAATGGLWNRHQIAGLTVTTGKATTSYIPSLQDPVELVSSNGSLVFSVSAQSNATTGNPQFLFNGATVPPTLRLLPGDTLVVNFSNNLPVPPTGAGYTNNSNLHYHGLHVSPQAPGDDSIDMLAAPGQSLHYAVQIPLNQPPGLYWYHTHAHGEAERQTLSGMSGALIIDGIAAYTPQVATMTERVLIARDATLPSGVLPSANLKQVYSMKWAMQHGVVMHASAGRSPAGAVNGTAMPMSAPPPRNSGTTAATVLSRDRSEIHASSTRAASNPYTITNKAFRRFVRALVTDSHCVAGSLEAPVKALTINGQTQPLLQIAPGEQQFWRMVNAGADTYLDVQVDNTQMQIVALDGVPLVSGVGAPAAMTVSHWVLPPASRVEFIVTGPPAGTTSYLRTNCFDSGAEGEPMPGVALATISPTAVSATQLAKLRRPVARISARAVRYRFNASSIRSSRSRILATAVSATQTLYYSDQNTINGVSYNPAAPPMFYAQSGTVQEWTIQNSSNEVHTFHIHQVHFVVEAINGIAQSPQFVMDNVNVPAASASGPGTVKLLLDFTDPTVIGTFLLHCHILSHEDGGMMAKIRVGTSPPLGLSAPSVTFANPTAGVQMVTVTGGAPPYSVTGCTGVANAAVGNANVSILAAGAGACVLTIADSSNPSLTATIAVQVNSGAAVISLAPTSVSFTAPTSAAQSVTISGGAAPYTVAGCTNIATGTVTNGLLSVSPSNVGTCSLTITDANSNQAALSVAVNAASTGGPLDNLTFHQNTLRNGWYQAEAVLNTTNVASSSFGKIGTLTPPAGLPGFGKVYAQPLYVTNETAVDGKRHNLIVVAGAADQVYAFDETTRAMVWHRDFTNPAAGIRQQLWTDNGCPDVNPNSGIVGTPVIDRARDAIYVVVATMENGVGYTRLHAIGLGNGTDLIAPTAITGSVALATGGTATISSVNNMNRPALLEANGTIYVALGSHCDADSPAVHGWVIGYSAATLAETGNLVDLSNANDGSGFYLGSVWMGGFGPAADAFGNIYFSTGNGPYNGTTNFSMSILKLPGNLNVAQASLFTPIQEAADSAADQDLASGGVMLLPDQPGSVPHMLIGGGKCSQTGLVGCFKYLLNRDVMGGQQTKNAGALWSANTAGEMFGGPAYFVDASGAQHIVYGTGSPLSTYTLGLSPVGLSVQSSANVGCLECRDSGSQPIVSSNGTQTGSAIVWALKTPSASGGTISLYAFDALNMSHTLFSGSAGSWIMTPGAGWVGGALISPLVANGRVYVPTDGQVTVFGLPGE